MSFGEELRRERELREISLKEVSEITKINIRYLQAMERNDFENLPGGVFNRGFVRAYCQAIGLDQEAMVNAYLLEEQSRGASGTKTAGGLLRGRDRGPASPSKDGRSVVDDPRELLFRWWFWVVALAVIAGGAYLYLRLGAPAEGSSTGPSAVPQITAVARSDRTDSWPVHEPRSET